MTKTKTYTSIIKSIEQQTKRACDGSHENFKARMAKIAKLAVEALKSCN